jgi:hypothetical protein
MGFPRGWLLYYRLFGGKIKAFSCRIQDSAHEIRMTGGNARVAEHAYRGAYMAEVFRRCDEF